MSSARRKIAGGAIGSFVEWYDFLIYGLSAPILAAKFFPQSSPVAALLGTFAIYAIAFFMRPLGGLFFGRLGDRSGRINTLALTVMTIGAATMLIGLLPTYATIGIAAPVLLLLCRLVQGFAVGGETSGGMSYVLEAAPRGRRAYWVSIVAAAMFLPGAVAGMVILGLRTVFGTEAYENWAWRIPFIVGAVLALIGLWLRRRLDDPEEYVEAARETTVDNRLRAVVSSRMRAMVIVVLLVSVMAVSAYLLNSYMYSYMVNVGGLNATTALVSNAAAILVISLLLPACGLVGDRIGRKPLLIWGAIWLLIVAYPAIVMAGSGSTAGAFTGQILLAIGIAIVNAGGFVAMLELFPTSLRYTGHALAYNIGYAIFGGTTPLIATFLVDVSGSTVIPAFYLMAIVLVSLIGIVAVPETRTFELRSAGAGLEHEESSSRQSAGDLAGGAL
ncbi:MFS transporter [Rhodococcus koreensis]